MTLSPKIVFVCVCVCVPNLVHFIAFEVCRSAQYTFSPIFKSQSRFIMADENQKLKHRTGADFLLLRLLHRRYLSAHAE